MNVICPTLAISTWNCGGQIDLHSLMLCLILRFGYTALSMVSLSEGCSWRLVVRIIPVAS
jgi:hypothetical protein